MRILQKVFLVAFAPTALAALVWIAFVWQLSRQTVVARQQTESRAHVEAMRQQVSSYFTGIRAVLDVEAKRLIPGEQEALLAELRSLENRLGTGADGIFLSLPDGEVLGTRDERFTSLKHYYDPILRQGNPVVTRILTSKASGQPSVIVLAPRIDSNGDYLGALGASVSVSALLQSISGFSLESRGGALLVDDTGRIEASGVDAAVVSELLPPILAAEHGEADIELAGSPSHLVFVHVQGTPWKLALLYPYRDVLRVQHQILAASALVLFIAVVTGLIGYLLLRRLVSRPVQRLVKAHTAMAQGMMSVRLESLGQDEFAALAASFNTMAEQLQRSEEDLHCREELQATITANIPGVVFRFFARPDGAMGLAFVGERCQEIVDVAAVPYETFFERFLERLGPEQKEPFLASIEIAVRDRLPWSFDGSLCRRTGEKTWFHAQSQPRTVGGELIFDGVLFDITERKRAEDALLRSEANLQAIMDNTGDIIASYDREARLVAYNRPCIDIYKTLFGIDIHVGLRTLDLYPDDVRSLFAAKNERVLAGESFSIELEYPIANEKRVFETSFHPIRQGDDVVGFSTVSRDITARKQAEETLRKNEEKYRELVQNANSIILRMDTEGNVTFFNEYAQRFFGYTEDQILGCNVVGTIVPEKEFSGRDLRAMIHDICTHTTDFTSNENENIKHNGEHVWIAWTNRPLLDDSGRLVGVLCVGTDISARKQAEEGLRESEARFRSIIAVSNTGAWEYHRETDYLWCSPEYFTMLGLDPDRFITDGTANIQEAWLNLLHPDDRQNAEQHFMEYLDNGSIGMYESYFRMRHGNGSWIWIWSRGQTLRNPDGSVLNITLGTHIDITERKRAEMEFKENEARLRAITDSAQDAIIMMDPQGAISFWNPAAETTLGYRADEVLGRNLHELLAPGLFLQAHKAAFPEFQKTGLGPAIGRTLELAILRKDGQEITVALSLSAVSVHNAWHAVGIIRDVTEQRHAEEALRRSEANFAAIMANTTDIIASYDRERRLVAYNQACSEAYRRFFGVELCPGFRTIDVFPKPMQELWNANDARVLAGESFEFEFEFSPVGGERQVFEASYHPIRQGAEIVGFSTTARNVTERKRTEEALIRATALLQAAIEQTPAGVLFADAPDMTIRLANTAALSTRSDCTEPPTGISVELNPYHWLAFWPDGTPIAPEDLPLSRAILKGETVRNEEVLIQRSDGELRHVLANAAPVRNPQGEIVAGIVVFPDITDFRSAEEEREKLQTQLLQAQKTEAVGRLAGGVAHDFNNMLGVILGHVELALKRMPPDDPLRADLNDVRKAAQRSADLTRQLLTFARKQTVVPKVVDLNATVEGMLKMLRRLIGEDIDLAWLPGNSLGAVFIDPSQVDQLLANLCVNARDAIAGTGRLTIETDNATIDTDYCAQHAESTPGEYVLLAVSDNGCGMDRQTLANVFEPFFTTKETGKGTGLGLATVHGIVKQNNGFINVYSKPGCGTTFRVYLPRHHSATEPVNEETANTTLPTGSETILVVEDEPTILDMTKLILEQLGYTVLAAGTPTEAIRLGQEHAGRIDLVMTDVIMPEMNGRDLAKKLTSNHPCLKCLFMSGYTADVIAHQGVLDEGLHFIQKPFSIAEVADKIREVLQNR